MGDVNGQHTFGSEGPPDTYSEAVYEGAVRLIGSEPLHTPSGNPGNSGNEPWWSSSIAGSDLDSTVYPPLTYLVERVITEGSLTLLAGPPKAGKSYAAFSFACAVAAGGMALGGLASTGPFGVLMVSLDDQSRARAQRRLREVMEGAPIPENITLHTEANLGQGKAAAASIIEYLDGHPDTRLVVVDTLEHLRGITTAGESSYTADVRFLGYLRAVLTNHPKVTLLVLVHTRKGENDDPISAVSGTHGVSGGADAVLVITGKRGAPRRILDVVGRDAEDARLVLAWTDHGLSLTDEDPDDPTLLMTKDDAAVYLAVKDCKDPVSAKDLELILELPKIGNRLAKLANDGHLRKTGRGLYEVA